ncbi:unnamed protein product [Adineta steineri]|uniref:EGF-like domain-containing protein n=1 Tax=Adineta steineri TaxID=433720 RepID=A0A815T1J6_9BILA|nr:unnamed protein product [Adineta steineri]CAF1499342.1 unnamed protein product [Adineta steineri]
MLIFIVWFFIIISINGECANKTCVYGQCFNARCICDPGIYGDICDKDIEDCDNESCMNNGTCIELVNGFACHCLPDFDGSRCQHRRTKHDNHCKKTCYNNGKCVLLNNKEKCSCLTNYYGSECEYTTHNNTSSAIRKCSLLKYRNSHNEATCLAIGLTPSFSVDCTCHYDHENKNMAICQITPSPYLNEKCTFKKAISLSPLSTLYNKISIHVCPINWQILDQYENTQEKVNSVHITECQLEST